MEEPGKSSLVALSPPQTLTFDLGMQGEIRATLNITNISDKKIIFKIKTSQPTWYLVRPNQNVIDVGKTETVIIALTESERSKVMDLSTEGSNTLNLDKHRFLLMSKAVDSLEYSSLVDLPPAQRGEEFARLWAAGKDDVSNLKLKVQFVYPEPGSRSQSTSSRGGQEGAEALRSRLAREDTGSDPTDPEALLNELLNLRKKYDAVVDYSAHLTAERDSIVGQFEDLQREHAREIGQKRAEAKGGKAEVQAEKKNVQQGFSLLSVVVVMIVGVLIGKFLRI